MINMSILVMKIFILISETSKISGLFYGRPGDTAEVHHEGPLPGRW